MPGLHRIRSRLSQADRIVLNGVDHRQVDVMVHASGYQFEAIAFCADDRANMLAVGTLRRPWGASLLRSSYLLGQPLQ